MTLTVSHRQLHTASPMSGTSVCPFTWLSGPQTQEATFPSLSLLPGRRGILLE